MIISIIINSKCLLRDGGPYPEVWCKIAELKCYPYTYTDCRNYPDIGAKKDQYRIPVMTCLSHEAQIGATGFLIHIIINNVDRMIPITHYFLR